MLALVIYVNLQLHRLLGLSAQPPLMMLCMVLRGIISPMVGAKLRQPKGLPRLCVRNVGKLKLLVLQSKSSIVFVTPTHLSSIINILLSQVSHEALCI